MLFLLDLYDVFEMGSIGSIGPNRVQIFFSTRDFKWKRKINLFKAISALSNTFSSWNSRLISCIRFCNFLVNYTIKIIYFVPNISKRKNNHRLYSSKLIKILVEKLNSWFSILFLKSKHKIYTLSKTVSFI